MSTPANPLDFYQGYSVKHLLVAFEYTESACKTKVPYTVGMVGTQLPKTHCGKAVVVVNDMLDSKYNILDLRWTYNYFSHMASSTTSLIGNLQISQQIPGEFPMFLAQIGELYNMSITHLTFWLRTVFICRRPDGTDDYILTKPLIFHASDSNYSFAEKTANVYTMNFLATYNTFGQLPSFSGIHQMTITHKDGALHKEIPKPEVPTCGIMTRQAEDAAKSEARKTRLDKSKPMKNMKEVFEAFELELKEQRFAHKRQLQELMDRIRNPGYVKKINEVEQKKGDELPLDYIFGLSGNLESEVDNRNMPFEQPEQSQDKPGIRSITIPPGKNIVTAIDYLMKFSKQNGVLAEGGATWKTNLAIVRRCGGKYDVFVNLNQAEIPRNEQNGRDTGPGKSVVENVLNFTFDEYESKDNDIRFVHIFSNSDINFAVMEDQVSENEAEVNYGGREQMTLERIPQKRYFRSNFSGVRGMSDPINFGLESAEDAAKIDYSLNRAILDQTTQTQVEIRGNPHLYSDLVRNPWKVKNRDPDNPILYKFPETYPIYVKLKIAVKPTGSMLGQEDDTNIPDYFYHTKHYHVSTITSIINGSGFYQILQLNRTDEAT